MKLSKKLILPPEAVTQTFGVMGLKGSGKTYFASKLFEVFYAAGVQCIVLDPVGLWYGLRLNKQGTGPSSITAPVFGGNHGDLPLTQDSAKIIADFLLESSSSAILDVSQLRKGARKEFVAHFAEELFHAQKTRRIPLHLFIDESQLFVPQHPNAGEQRMLGAMEDIVRLGRNFGIGVTLISQRPQSVNKEVLNQVEPLVVFQLVAAHERKAVNEWIVYSGADVKEELKSLPSLEKGYGYFWSPSWMKRFELFRCDEKQTFDSTATPAIGYKPPESTHLSKTEIQNLSAKIQEMAEQAEQNKPEVLKRKIATLEKELRLAAKGVPESEVNKRIKEAVAEATKNLPAAGNNAAIIALGEISAIADKALKKSPKVQERGNVQVVKQYAAEPMKKGSPEQRVLNSLAWWESTGIASPYSRIQVAFVADYKPKSGGFNNLLGKLRTAGLIDYPGGGTVELTEAGRAAADPVEKPATQAALTGMVMGKLSNAQQKILQVAMDAYPNEISKEQLGYDSGYQPGSGGFNNNVSSLRTLGLLDYPRSGHVKAESILFV